jgi:hypothetical protein
VSYVLPLRRNDNGSPSTWRARIGKVTLRRAANVERLDVVTRLDLDPVLVLGKAAEAGLERVVLAGYTRAGQEYFAASMADGGDAVLQAVVGGRLEADRRGLGHPVGDGHLGHVHPVDHLAHHLYGAG